MASWIIAVIGWVLMKIFHHEPTRKWLYWLSAPLLIFALLISLSATFRTQPVDQRPELHFTGRLLGGGIFDSQRTITGTYLSLVLTIANTGAPTSIGAYSGTAKIPNAETPLVVAERQTIPMGGMRLGEEWLCGEDALDRRTINPIPHGGLQQGRLVYAFPTVPMTMFTNTPNVTFTVSVADAWGKEWDFPMPIVVTGSKLPVLNFPALRQQPILPLPLPPTAPKPDTTESGQSGPIMVASESPCGQR